MRNRCTEVQRAAEITWRVSCGLPPRFLTPACVPPRVPLAGPWPGLSGRPGLEEEVGVLGQARMQQAPGHVLGKLSRATDQRKGLSPAGAHQLCDQVLAQAAEAGLLLVTPRKLLRGVLLG